MSNSTKRLQNNVVEYEIASDKKVPFESYYVIHIIIDGEAQTLTKILAKNLSREINGSDGRPLAVYHYFGDIYLLFSSLETLQHNFSGSHHLLCSFYSSSISRTHRCNTTCSVIELDTRTKVLTYFHVKIFECTKKTLIKLACGAIKENEIETLTLGECIKIVEDKTKQKWDSFPPNLRYGIFYKYRIKDSREKVATFSEFLNLGNTSKFEFYIFSKSEI